MLPCSRQFIEAHIHWAENAPPTLAFPKAIDFCERGGKAAATTFSGSNRLEGGDSQRAAHVKEGST